MSAAAPHPRPVPPMTAPEVTRTVRERPHRILELGDDRVAYWRFGQGPDLVFVHGWPVTAATFRHLVPELARHFTCHLFDLPGAGHTRSSSDHPLTLRAHTRTVAEVVDALALDAYALLAHDSGAVMARIVAAAHGSRVRALVIAGTEIPGHRPWFVQALVLLSKIPGGLGLLRFALRSGVLRRSRLGFGGCFTDPATVDGEFHELFVVPLLASEQAYAGQMRLVRGLDFAEVDTLRELHARIEAPVLMVWGTRDPFFPLERAKTMLDQFSTPAVLHEIPGGKLFTHEDHPDAFLEAALPFLLDAVRS